MKERGGRNSLAIQLSGNSVRLANPMACIGRAQGGACNFPDVGYTVEPGLHIEARNLCAALGEGGYRGTGIFLLVRVAISEQRASVMRMHVGSSRLNFRHEM